MAEKEKKSLMSLLGKEYKYEGLLLLVLGIITTVLGVLIHLGVTTKGSEGLVINENFYFIGEYPKLFAWVLIILGAAAIILATVFSAYVDVLVWLVWSLTFCFCTDVWLLCVILGSIYPCNMVNLFL